MFKVEVVLDSISPRGQRLTTFRTEFPRSILSEVNTHCVLSKNAASSRAIPFPRMVEKLLGNTSKDIKPDPYIPDWSLNQSGMQEKGFLKGNDADLATRLWLDAMRKAIDSAKCLHDLGIHKQDINRLIEPWAWVRQVISGVAWSNFFALRTHKDAHPAFRLLARAMYIAYKRSQPTPLDYNQWHLPFIQADDYLHADDLHGSQIQTPEPHWTRSIQTLCRWSAARCARVSYELFDGKPTTPDKDEDTYSKLVGGDIKHLSPLQHQGTPLHPAWEAGHPELKSNLFGYIQYRKMILGENIAVFSPSQAEIDAWEVPEEIFV